MSTKKDILENPREYSSDEIAEAIKSGVITMYELSKSGKLTPLMRSRIEEKLAKAEPSKEDIEVSERAGTEQQVTKTPVDSKITENPDSEALQDKKEANDIYNGRIFLRPFSFRGRIRRSEYAFSLFIFYVVMFSLGILRARYASNISHADKGDMFNEMLIELAIWISILFMLAQSCKRCQDRGHNGWWQFIPFYWLYLLFADSKKGANKYGTNPKGIN